MLNSRIVSFTYCTCYTLEINIYVPLCNCVFTERVSTWKKKGELKSRPRPSLSLSINIRASLLQFQGIHQIRTAFYVTNMGKVHDRRTVTATQTKDPLPISSLCRIVCCRWKAFAYQNRKCRSMPYSN